MAIWPILIPNKGIRKGHVGVNEKRNPGCLGYIGDEKLPRLCRDEHS